MKLTEERLVPLAVATLCLLVVLQTVPVSIALPSSPDSPGIKALPGFKVQGAAPDSLPVTVSLAIPLRNLDLLSSLVKQVSDPTSPMFRHYPSQEMLARDFYPTAEFDQLMRYVSATGLQVQYTALDSTVVLQGTASQVERAFGTDLKVYSNGTASYYMSTSESFMGAYLFASNATAIELKPAVAGLGTAGANVTFTEGDFSPKLLQAVYNATWLYSKGFNGSGKTIGLVDFYGSPTIRSDLASFDKRFGVPDANFTILPIGPYDPNLGAFTSWSTEVSIDVEMSHTMAPGAAIDLYVASGASTLSDVISKIVKDDKVNTLSQSFTNADWAYSYLGPGFFDLNALMPDQYYMLGALKGITFSGSTGDTGGSGDTMGVEGQLGYPSDSPYVTAVGGTQTYFAGSSSFQTGWSNFGYVPNGVNAGGSSGGVSILEPKPWYQASQDTPASLPAGRMAPDLSLQSGIYPATEIVDSGQVVGEGGTSMASPLFAGLVTLLDSSVNASAGLINPFIYSIGDNPSSYTKGFTPITYGYNIPWVASRGYNLVTGWGSPNIGGIHDLYQSDRSRSSLNVTVELYPGNHSSGLEYISGDMLRFNATIKDGSQQVTSGSFSATLVTLTNDTSIPLRYDAAEGVWVGSLTIGAQEGLAYVDVQGSGGGAQGSGFAPLFVGYYGLFLYPLPTDPWSTIGGLKIDVHSITLDGTFSPSTPLHVEVETYSITRNSYSRAAVVDLPFVNGTLYGAVNEGVLNESIPTGPSVMVVQGGTYGYLPFVSGIYLQASFIYPPVLAEPGAAAPGQKLTVVASPTAPFNLYFTLSQETGLDVGSDVAVGSNVTAKLVSPNGTVVSTASLAYQACKEALRICSGTVELNGYVDVPQNATPGLYTVLLNANYSSVTIGKTLNGSFFGQVWVSDGPAHPAVSVEPGFIAANAVSDPGFATSPGQAASNLYEGEQAHLVARIAYPNGTSARYGEYSAVVYPQSLQGQYTTVMHSELVSSKLVQLTYDPALQAWLANVTLPGPGNAGTLAPINSASFFYSGPYEVYVTGITADGMVTTTAEAAQQPFFIQPYIFVEGNVTSLTQGSGLAFSGATIRASGSLDGDLFLGRDVVRGGAVTITGSRILGSLDVVGANVTLVGDSGGDVSALNSGLTLTDSSIGRLSLDGSRVTLADSSYKSVSPALPTVTVTGLDRPLSQVSNFNVTIAGPGLVPGSLAATIDGSKEGLKENTTASGIEAVGSINATALADGIHYLVLTVSQSDGLATTASFPFSSNSKETSLADELSQATASVQSLQARLSQSSGFVDILFAFVILAVAMAAVAIGLFVFRRKPQLP